jgi:pimeloyl-ACP methyl ester carboxylesterase
MKGPIERGYPNRPLEYMGRTRECYKYFVTGYKGRMRGPYSFNWELQDVGDKGRVDGQLVLCRNGWHAGSGRWMRNATHFRDPSTTRIFKVRLSGGVWRSTRTNKGKFLGRAVELLYEVRWNGQRYVKKRSV